MHDFLITEVFLDYTLDKSSLLQLFKSLNFVELGCPSVLDRFFVATASIGETTHLEPSNSFLDAIVGVVLELLASLTSTHVTLLHGLHFIHQ